MSELLSTPEERASYFAGIARAKSNSYFKITTDYALGPTTCGVNIRRRNRGEVRIREAHGIIDSLGDSARELGGIMIVGFQPIPTSDDVDRTFRGVYQFQLVGLLT